MKLKTAVIFFLVATAMASCKKEQGCTNINACNYNIDAEEDDGTCLITGQSCDDGNENTVNDAINALCFCQGAQPDLGCMDDQACNYESDATVDDDSCLFPGDPCNDGSAGTINDVYISNCECQGESANYGCMDNTACNYEVLANVDDGSCDYPGDPCNDFSPVTINDTYDANCNCVGITPSIGCTNSNACNYNALADTDDGSCQFPGDPCNDGNANTLDDVWNSSCECTGTPASDDACAIGTDGYADVYWGVNVDGYPGECSWYIYLQDDPTVVTDVITTTTANQIVAETWGFTPGTWVMTVEDSYGDGKLSDGYYFAQCLTNGGDWVDLFVTPFTTGYESSTSFTIGDGLVGPNPDTYQTN